MECTPPCLGRDHCLDLRSMALGLGHLPTDVARYDELPSAGPTDSEGVHLPC
jgi:hypothetical protein